MTQREKELQAQGVGVFTDEGKMHHIDEVASGVKSGILSINNIMNDPEERESAMEGLNDDARKKLQAIIDRINNPDLVDEEETRRLRNERDRLRQERDEYKADLDDANDKLKRIQKEQEDKCDSCEKKWKKKLEDAEDDFKKKLGEAEKEFERKLDEAKKAAEKKVDEANKAAEKKVDEANKAAEKAKADAAAKEATMTAQIEAANKAAKKAEGEAEEAKNEKKEILAKLEEANKEKAGYQVKISQLEYQIAQISSGKPYYAPNPAPAPIPAPNPAPIVVSAPTPNAAPTVVFGGAPTVKAITDSKTGQTSYAHLLYNKEMPISEQDARFLINTFEGKILTKDFGYYYVKMADDQISSAEEAELKFKL